MRLWTNQTRVLGSEEAGTFAIVIVIRTDAEFFSSRARGVCGPCILFQCTTRFSERISQCALIIDGSSYEDRDNAR